jgi:D-alanine-D-alanine ligase
VRHLEGAFQTTSEAPAGHLRPYVILYNRDENVRGGDPKDRIAVQGNLDSLEPIRAAVAKLGRVELVEITDGDPEPIARELKRLEPRAVFNLAEAARGVPELEAAIASVLELLGLAYTGNTSQTLGLCLDKPKTKLLLHGAGLPVPRGITVRDVTKAPFHELEYPVIVKPAFMDASHGIEPSNVVSDERAARAKAAELLEKFPPAVIVEHFVDGREINVAIVELEVGRPTILPLAEIDWRLPAGTPRVCGYEAKWVEGTESFAKTPIVCPTVCSRELETRLREIALAAYTALGCRDYARVDLRVDAAERPYILEVNPNPCISPIAGVARSAGVAGWSYDELIRRLVRNAEQRGPFAPLARRR